jgi:hypothetical protein
MHATLSYKIRKTMKGDQRRSIIGYRWGDKTEENIVHTVKSVLNRKLHMQSCFKTYIPLPMT